MLTIAQLKKYLTKRIMMLCESGYQTVNLQKRLEQLPDSYDAIVAFAKEMSKLRLRDDFGFVEPDTLEEILKEQCDGKRNRLTGYINEQELKDKIFGGVYGRMAGCVLGKPMEMDMTPAQHKKYLMGCGCYPLSSYIPSFSPTQSKPIRRDCIESTREHIEYVQEDDDINYIIMALHYLEEYGARFTTANIAKTWLQSLPIEATFGPEKFRYYTLSALALDDEEYPEDNTEKLEYIRLFSHGCDMHIGAMIRGDIYGLVNPGRIDVSTKMAYNDAVLTHTKNGIYQELWAAAAISAAFYERNAVEVINIANAHVPQNSRYAEILNKSLEIATADDNFEKCAIEIEKHFGSYGIGSGVTETAAIINSLVHVPYNYGIIDYEKAICTTVMQGWDTDCAGATIGCITGVIAGHRNIPDKWLTPLNDTVYSWVATERETKISKIAQRVYNASVMVRNSIL